MHNHLKSEFGMTKFLNIINDEKGVSLLPALVILLIGTLIGLAATSTTTFEINTASNERIYKRNFFRADATNQLGSQRIEDSDLDDLRERNHDWMTDFNGQYDFYLDENNWCTQAMVDSGDCIAADINGGDGAIADTRFMVVDHGGAPGTEISMGSPFMHELGVYARYDSAQPRSRVIIQTKYRKKY